MQIASFVALMQNHEEIGMGDFMKRTFFQFVCLCMILLLAGGCSSTKDKESTKKAEEKDTTSTEKTDKQNSEGVYDESLVCIVSQGLYYKMTGEDTIALSGYEDEDSEKIEIPQTVTCEGKEYKVTAIEDEALSYQSSVEEVILPETITSIGKEAFCGCGALKSIKIPDSVVSMGTGVFYDCAVLKSCELGKGMVQLPDEIFTNCYELSDILLPDTIVSIGKEAFWACEALEEMQLPESVVAIGNRAFYSSGIKKLVLSSAAISLNDEMLDGLDNLEEIVVPAVLQSTAEELLDYTECKVTIFGE